MEYVVILFLISYASCCASNAFCCSSNFSPSKNIALIKLPHICYNFFLLNEFKASLTILTLNYNTCTIMVMVFIKKNQQNKQMKRKPGLEKIRSFFFLNNCTIINEFMMSCMNLKTLYSWSWVYVRLIIHHTLFYSFIIT